MATQSVTNSDNTELFSELASIEALARLLMKAHQSISEEHSGVYGAALIIEEKAGKCLQLIDQA